MIISISSDWKYETNYGFICWKPWHSNMSDVGVYFCFGVNIVHMLITLKSEGSHKPSRWTILGFEWWWRKVVAHWCSIDLLRVWWIWWWWMKVSTPTYPLQNLWMYSCHFQGFSIYIENTKVYKIYSTWHEMSKIHLQEFMHLYWSFNDASINTYMKWVMLYVHNLRGRFQVSLQIQERICTKIKFGVEMKRVLLLL